ncbi:MAG TPA: VCBS repeat-containing protein [Acidobacteriota bacterium]|nr:VCBS repeat-containing protein [Acidobacteriota bacterium]
MFKDCPTALLFLSLIMMPAFCQAAPPEDGDILRTPLRHETGRGPSAVAVGDLNGDGHLDVLVANQPDGDLSLFAGDGRGGLTPLGRVACGESPTGLAVADLDGDGPLDVVVANHETDYLTILKGDGSGGLSPAPNSPLKIEVDPHPHEVRIADLNQDGHLDLIVDHRNGEGLLILAGQGGGRFDAGRLVATGGDPYRGMEAVDVDNDGKLDLLTPNPGDVGVVLGEDPAQFSFQPVRRVEAGRPFALALGDLNGDGRLDLGTASEPAGSPELFRSEGGGRFTKMDVSLPQLSSGAKNIVSGDFNGDGFGDMAVANWSSSQVLLLVGGADGVTHQRLEAAVNPFGMASADLNEDGRDDLLVTGYTDSKLVLLLSRGPHR